MQSKMEFNPDFLTGATEIILALVSPEITVEKESPSNSAWILCYGS